MSYIETVLGPLLRFLSGVFRLVVFLQLSGNAS